MDQRFGRTKLDDARNFANKLWNATRFVIGARPAGIASDSERLLPDPALLGPAERWILSRVSATSAEVDRALADYAFGEYTRLVYDGIWSEFCDWGLELAKVRLADPAIPTGNRAATWWTLVEALDTYLRLLHPVMPFVTEALWAALPHRASDPELLIVARWPGIGPRDLGIEGEVGTFVDLIRGIRNARSEARISPATWLPIDVTIEPSLGITFEALRSAIERLARARPLTRWLTREALEAGAVAGGLTVIAREAEAIVRLPDGATRIEDGERARLEKELAEAESWLERARERLANEEFVAKAPPAVVDGARAREAELAEQVARLRSRLGR
jgi:valyl-tRNA synthetase